MKYNKDATPTSHDLSLGVARAHSKDNVPISACLVVQHKASELWSGEVAGFSSDDSSVKHESSLMKSCGTNLENVISGGVKYAAKQLLYKTWTTMIEESSDYILHKWPQNKQSGIRSIVYNFVEQRMLDMPHEDVIWNKTDDQTAKLIDINFTANRLSQR